MCNEIPMTFPTAPVPEPSPIGVELTATPGPQFVQIGNRAFNPAKVWLVYLKTEDKYVELTPIGEDPYISFKDEGYDAFMDWWEHERGAKVWKAL